MLGCGFSSQCSCCLRWNSLHCLPIFSVKARLSLPRHKERQHCQCGVIQKEWRSRLFILNYLKASLKYNQHVITYKYLGCTIWKLLLYIHVHATIVTMKKVGIEENLLNMVKNSYKNPTKYHTYWEKLEAFSVRSAARQGCPLSWLLINSIVTP